MLNAVTCDGETMLITLPIPTKIVAAVTAVSNAIGGVGIIMSGLTIGAVWVFQ
jgi:hypothetical protein